VLDLRRFFSFLHTCTTAEAHALNRRRMQCRYSALADLLSAVLQMVTIFLEVVGKEKWASTVELIDRLVQALTSTSAALLLAVDDITSCGPPRGRRSGACRSGQTRGFCGRVRVSAALSLAAAVTVSACIYTNRLAATVTQAPAPEEKKKESIYTYRLAPTVTLTPARKEKEAEEKKKKEEEGKGEEKRKKKDEEER
jgi:hypothetical protein